MQLIIWKWVLIASLIVYPTVGLTYVGPGLGVGALALILGILGSVLLALFTIFWYPLKRMLQRWKQKRTGEDADTK
ncbi:hypothetical protein [Candidatus Thiosymbion oneisti]|uniref:hypothetical protein n=1 Tax=Candidatus Thiosymbion oneisti TaxID=589554 RepID=UPI001A9CA57E|nr:hypothetical protein [Candidatus Thiosymbion oneisti]